MVIYNAATRELTAKIVYYGPGLCGKTTNLKVLHDRLEPGTAGKLLNLQTQTDRTIYFDLLPVELGDIKGYKIRFQLATVPGQTAFNETRRVVLKGVDGIVFVADSQWTMLPKNLEAWQNLKDNLKVNSITFESIPVVIQYNKRDLADILAVDAMQEALGLSSYPFVEAVASAGRGVTETFKLISKLTFVDLLRRLQGRRAEEEALESARTEEQIREDDLQTWKDSLLKRESQPAVARPSRPLSLVPPVLDEAPFDTTELGRGVDDDESDSPYSVPAPPGMGMTSEPEIPELSRPGRESGGHRPHGRRSASISTLPRPLRRTCRRRRTKLPRCSPRRMRSRTNSASASPRGSRKPCRSPRMRTRPMEAFAPAGRSPSLRSPAAASAFLPPESVHDERVDVLEQRLQELDARAGREREAAERLSEVVVGRGKPVRGHGRAPLGSGRKAGRRGARRRRAARGARVCPAAARGRRRRGRPRAAELEGGLRRLEATVGQLEGDLRGESGRQRKDSDDMTMALSALTERAQAAERELSSAIGRLAGHNDRLSAVAELAERNEEQVAALKSLAEKLPVFEAQIESIFQEHRELQEAFEEKTRLGAARSGGHPFAGRVDPSRSPRAPGDVRGEDPARPPRSGGHPIADRAAARGPRPPARVGRDALRRDGTAAGVARGIAPRSRRARRPVRDDRRSRRPSTVIQERSDRDPARLRRCDLRILQRLRMTA